VCGSHESWPQEEILRWVAGRRELGEDDEVGFGGGRLVDGAEDLGTVAVEVADDDVQLSERDSQGFRLTVTNRV